MTLSVRAQVLRASTVAALSALAFVQCGGEQRSAEAPVETMPSAEPPRASEAEGATTRATPAFDPAVATAPSAQPSSPPPAPAPAPDPLTDEQIAAITDAANTAEISEAKIAQGKSKDADVKRFAAMMISHHSQAQQKQAKLKLKTADSGVATTLQTDAASTLNTLKTSTGRDFDKAYVSSQVDAHQKVLDTINDKLLPNVKNPELKAYLDEVKSRVEQHLKEARQLQHNLNSKTDSTPAGGAGGTHSG